MFHPNSWPLILFIFHFITHPCGWKNQSSLLIITAPAAVFIDTEFIRFCSPIWCPPCFQMYWSYAFDLCNYFRGLKFYSIPNVSVIAIHITCLEIFPLHLLHINWRALEARPSYWWKLLASQRWSSFVSFILNEIEQRFQRFQVPKHYMYFLFQKKGKKERNGSANLNVPLES